MTGGHRHRTYGHTSMHYISEFLTVPVYSRLCRVPKRRTSCAWCSQCYRLYVPSVIQL